MRSGSGTSDNIGDSPRDTWLKEYARQMKMFNLEEYFVLGHCCHYGVPLKLTSFFNSNNNQ